LPKILLGAILRDVIVYYSNPQALQSANNGEQWDRMDDHGDGEVETDSEGADPEDWAENE